MMTTDFECEQSGNAFMNHLHSSKCHLRQHYSPQNCPDKLYTDCSSMGPSPTYGCMRIFGRENPYICVIGTISGYIWQYICGRPYAVSGSAYSASLLQGGPLLYTNFPGDALQRNIVHHTLHCNSVHNRRVQCNMVKLVRAMRWNSSMSTVYRIICTVCRIRVDIVGVRALELRSINWLIREPCARGHTQLSFLPI